MTRSNGAQLVSEFVAALGKVPNLRVTPSDVSHNVWSITGDVNCLIYVKGRATEPLNWGVTANVVNRLKQRGQDWILVLLFEAKDTGYLLTSADVEYYIKDVWPLGNDGDYKPAAKRYLSKNVPFSSFGECVRDLRRVAG